MPFYLLFTFFSSLYKIIFNNKYVQNLINKFINIEFYIVFYFNIIVLEYAREIKK